MHFLLAAIVLPILPALSRDYHLTGGFIVLLESAFPLGAVLGYTVFGRVVETRGVNIIVRMSWVSQTLAMLALLLGLGGGFFLSRFFGGFATGILPALISTTRGSFETRGSLPRVSTLIAAVTAGSALGPLLVPFLVPNIHLVALIGVGVCIAGYAASPRVNAPPVALPAHTLRKTRWVPLLCVVGIMGGLGIIYQTSRLVLPFYDQSYLALGPRGVALALALLSWGAWGTQRLLAKFSTNIPPHTSYLGAAALILTAVAVMFSGHTFFLFLGVLAMAVGIGLADPLGSLLCLRYTKEGASGRTIGTVFTFLAGAKMIAPLLAAWLVRPMG